MSFVVILYYGLYALIVVSCCSVVVCLFVPGLFCLFISILHDLVVILCHFSGKKFVSLFESFCTTLKLKYMFVSLCQYGSLCSCCVVFFKLS